MKYILAIACNFILFNALGQTDTLARQLKRGIYRNAQEFINNAPSVITDFTTEIEWISGTDSSVVSARLVKAANTKFTFTPWGFCDGRYVYVSYVDVYRRQYWRVGGIGKNSFFTRALPNTVYGGASIIGAVTAVATAAAAITNPPSYEIR
jgi:hypothetical protein